MDRPWSDEKTRLDAKMPRVGAKRALRGHVVILGFKDTALEMAEHFRSQAKEVFLIDLDYRMHQILITAYKGVNGAPEKRCKPIEGTCALRLGQAIVTYQEAKRGYASWRAARSRCSLHLGFAVAFVSERLS